MKKEYRTPILKWADLESDLALLAYSQDTDYDPDEDEMHGTPDNVVDAGARRHGHWSEYMWKN